MDGKDKRKAKEAWMNVLIISSDHILGPYSIIFLLDCSQLTCLFAEMSEQALMADSMVSSHLPVLGQDMILFLREE